MSQAECNQFEAGLQKAKDRLAEIAKRYGGKDSDQYKKAERALAAYGKQGVDNGVTIIKENTKGAAATFVSGVAGRKTGDNPTGQNIEVKFGEGSFSGGVDSFEGSIIHEGSHVAAGSEWVKSGFKDYANPSNFQLEYDGYYLNSLIAEVAGANSQSYSVDMQWGLRKPYKIFRAQVEIWSRGWAEADRETLRKTNIEFLLRHHKTYSYTQDGSKAFVKGTKN